MRTLPALAFAFAISGGAAASAATIDPLNVIEHTNAVIFGSASTTSEIEGQAIIGGSLSSNNSFQINANPRGVTPLSGFAALTVYGSTSGQNGFQVNNGGSAYVGGAKGAKINFNGGGGYTSTAPANTITDFSTALNTYSTALSQLKPTSSFSSSGNWNATPNANGVAVFDITSAQLATQNFNLNSLNLNGATSVVINVSGTSFTDNFNDNVNGSIAQDIIWNFYQATTLTFNREIYGTVLADKAAVTNNSPIDGTLVAASYKGNAELHDVLYKGSNPLAGEPGDAPEPATWAMMLLGIGGVGGVLRAQRRRADRTAPATEASKAG